MKAMLIYRADSEQERPALNYMRDFAAQTGKQLPVVNPDSPQGADLCRLYDIMQFPAILVTDNEGHMQNLWTGEQLPTYSELSYYVEDQTTLAEPRQDMHV